MHELIEPVLNHSLRAPVQAGGGFIQNQQGRTRQKGSCAGVRRRINFVPGEDSGLEPLLGHSITCRIAMGPNAGRKAFTLQTLAPVLGAPAGLSGWRSPPASPCMQAYRLLYESARATAGRRPRAARLQCRQHGL